MFLIFILSLFLAFVHRFLEHSYTPVRLSYTLVLAMMIIYKSIGKKRCKIKIELVAIIIIEQKEY